MRKPTKNPRTLALLERLNQYQATVGKEYSATDFNDFPGGRSTLGTSPSLTLNECVELLKISTSPVLDKALIERIGRIVL